jgi:hypothetical protein
MMRLKSAFCSQLGGCGLRSKPRLRLPASLVLALILGLATAVRAAEPAIANLDLRGLTLGTTTTITVSGSELGLAPRLLLPFAAQQSLKPGNTPNQAIFEVTPAVDVVAGYYQLRVITEGGVSLPAIIGVDRLPQQVLAGPNTSTPIAQLPAALSGNAAGSQVIEATFTAAAGQPVTIEVEAQRLGSKLRPIVHLYDAKRKQIDWAWSTPALAGDCRLEAVLPAAGQYFVTVHDAEYATPGPGFFRLKIGQWSYIDQVAPAVVAKNQSLPLELFGASPVAKIDFPAAAAAGVVPLAWPADALWSGPRPWISVSSHVELIEQPAATGFQELGALTAGAQPAGVSGRLTAPYEEDRYRVAVTPGSKLKLEVFAERGGSPVDIALLVKNEMDALLARAEDSPGTLDPALEYTVPAGINTLLLGVVDTQGRGGSKANYRLTVSPEPADPARIDFSLKMTAERASLPVGGRVVVPVTIERRGYAGPLDLATNNLPPGLRIENGTIPAGCDGTLLTLVRDEDAFEPAILAWRGAAGGEERLVIFQGHPLDALQPWLASELAVAPTTGTLTDFDIDWRGLAVDAGIVPSRNLALPIRIIRPPSDSLVRLSLVTSQLPTLVNGQPDQNRLIRVAAPVELAANISDGDLNLVVPADLPSNLYDISVKAELLTANRATVLATSFAPVRRMNVKMPVAVKLATPRIDVALDAATGATVVATGKIERREGLTGDVVLSLAGLPPGARADAVTIKADAADFLLNIVLPANLPPGELKGLKLSALGTPDAAQPAVKVKSRDVDLLLVVQPPAT